MCVYNRRIGRPRVSMLTMSVLRDLLEDSLGDLSGDSLEDSLGGFVVYTSIRLYGEGNPG